MAKQVSKTAIGAFVVGAITLIVVLIVIVGSGKFFTTAIPCVLYFDGSVQGLSVGSPLKFRGVSIGEVTEIKMTLDQDSMAFDIPVYAVIYPERIVLREGQTHRKNLKAAIEAGLRAQLQTQSLITGQLMIALDVYPDAAEPVFRGDGSLPEIPTIPTVIEQLAEIVKNIRLDEILEKLTRTADGIEKLVNDPDIAKGFDEFNDTMDDIQLLVQNFNRHIDPLSGSLLSTSDEFGRLAKNINKEINSMSGALEKTLAAAQATAEQMEKTLTNSANITSPGSPVMYELLTALRELSEASRSMRSLADYLERHPESLIFGKGDSR